MQKKVYVKFGMCRQCRSKRVQKVLLWLLASGLALAAAIYGATENMWPLFVIGLVLFFVFLITAAFSPNIATAQRIDERWVHLKGAGPKFLDQIPDTSEGRQ